MVMEQYSREEEIKTKEKKNSEEAKSLAAIGPVFTSWMDWQFFDRSQEQVYLNRSKAENMAVMF